MAVRKIAEADQNPFTLAVASAKAYLAQDLIRSVPDLSPAGRQNVLRTVQNMDNEELAFWLAVVAGGLKR
jgi:hypothetical protein